MYLKKESRMVRCEQWNVRVGLVLLEQFIGCADLVFLLRLCTNSIHMFLKILIKSSIIQKVKDMNLRRDRNN
jgi:hypothetical protein